MPTGLKVPVGVNKSGGAAIEKNEVEQTKKLLFLAFGEDDDNNPFQRVGVPLGLLFKAKTPGLRAKIQRVAEGVLAKFVDRISLAPDDPIKFEETTEGEIEMSFEYVDLSVNKVEEFRKKFSR